MKIILQTAEEEAREIAGQLLSEPCVECGRVHAPVALLIDTDHEEGPFVLCVECGSNHRLAVVDVQPRLLAVLAADEFADKTVFMLELARHWNAGRVPIDRFSLYDQSGWAQA